MLHRLEAVLIHPRFWIATIIAALATPMVAVLIRWLEAQSDFIAFCRGILFGGR